MFKKFVKDKAEEFFGNISNKKIRVIAHHDADGISSAGILLEALENLKANYHISIFKRINERNLKLIGRSYDVYIFLDLGTRVAKEIKEYTNGEIYIIDHHRGEEYPEDVNIINPFLFGIDGDSEISSSGITYLFSKDFIEKNHYLAIVGAFGDVQINSEAEGLNYEILSELIYKGYIEVKRGLRVFGRTYKPIHKAISNSIDPYIPLSEEDVLKIMKELKIDYKIGDYVKTLSDLTEDEEKLLISQIIIEMIKRGYKFDPKSLIGKIYLQKDKKGFLSDLRESATILNAFGRMKKYSDILLILLGKKDEKIILDVLEEYRKELGTILGKIEKGEIKVEKFDKVKIIRGENDIREEIIGTITSILFSSGEEKLVVGIGFSDENYLKISLRGRNINCEEIVREICEKLGCEGGGHEQAAGLEIERKKLEEFLKILRTMI